MEERKKDTAYVFLGRVNFTKKVGEQVTHPSNAHGDQKHARASKGRNCSAWDNASEISVHLQEESQDDYCGHYWEDLDEDLQTQDAMA